MPSGDKSLPYSTFSPFKTASSTAALEDMYGVIDGVGGPEINAVGRHHPGGDALGGTTNFLFTDGSVARRTILETMKRREWGLAYYSLTGSNTEVLIGQ